MKKIRIEGKHFVKGSEKVIFRGFNLGNWLLMEAHMTGFAHVDYKIRETFKEVLGKEKATNFFDSYIDNYMGKADFKYIQELGVNLVRLPFSWRLLYETSTPKYCFKEEGFSLIQKILDDCAEHNIYVLLDLHAAPGGQALDYNADNSLPEALLFTDSIYQERTVNLWKEIATRFKKHPALMGYDPIGEPVCSDPCKPWNPELLNDIYRVIQKEIRKIDTETVIILEGNQWSENNKSLSIDLFDDPQTTYQTHIYPVSYLKNDWPGIGNDGKVRDKKWLRNYYMNTLDIERIERPVLVGEFGINAQDPHLEKVIPCIKDFIGIMEEEGHSWIFWAYKDIGLYSLMHIDKDSQWSKVLLNDELKLKKQKLSDFCSPKYHMPESAQPLLFKEALKIFPNCNHEVLRHKIRETERSLNLVLLQEITEIIGSLPDKEINNLPNAFSFENCTPHPVILECLYSYFKKNKENN